MIILDPPECPMEIGKCYDSDGNPVQLKTNNEAIKLDSIDDRSNERLMKCFRKCRGTPLATGCEVFSGIGKRNGCYVHTGDVVFGRVPVDDRDTSKFRACWVFSKCTDGES